MGELRGAMEKRGKAGGILVVNAAKRRTPVGTPESTGVEGYRGGRLRDGNTSDGDETGFVAGNNVRYTRPVHDGTYDYRHDGEWTEAEAAELAALAGAGTGDGEGGRKGMQARPFLVLGFFDAAPELTRLYGAPIRVGRRGGA